jgi:hypothetical protein
MNAGEQLSRIAPYVSRALEDDYVQEQLGQGVASLRRGTRRAKGKSAKAAIADPKVHHNLRDAAASLSGAFRTIKEPPPKKHRLRRVLVVGALSGVAVLGWRQINPAGEGGTS